MQTKLAEFIKRKPESAEMENILRSCVHCGFCTATCPTYQLLGDELDGPRGRIYLLKQMAEGQPVGRLTQRHLDRCLTCRSCETTCPSGVRYGRLLDIGREIVDELVSRPMSERITRRLLLAVFPFRRRFGWLLSIARRIKPVLPSILKLKIPENPDAGVWPEPRHARKMLIFPGCVQPELAPSIDAAAARVLDRLGISLIPIQSGGCCGALNYHLSDSRQALTFARSNIDACWPAIEQGAEAIVMTASGCGVMMKDYGDLLKHDEAYADRASRVSALAKDLSEVLINEDLSFVERQNAKVAFHAPCSLQHGQKITGVVEAILERTGFRLAAVADAHLCCGSAGVYSLLQQKLSGHLRDNKLKALTEDAPELIVTANIGCLMQLQSAGSSQVRHWIELIDEALDLDGGGGFEIGRRCVGRKMPVSQDLGHSGGLIEQKYS
ncbi:MAG: glycolate oxidase subunit GlcF [Gammaproteobacteria bacterium]